LNLRALLRVILSENNRVRAAVLHAEYCHRRSQIMGDEALEALLQQYHKVRCSVTPIHCLPVEMFIETFHVALDMGNHA